MTTLLHLDSSASRQSSRSRRLAEQFIARWKAVHPDAKVLYRDLAADPPPHLADEAHVVAWQTQPDKQTPEMKKLAEKSDQLVDELLSADRLVISCPMYNFTIPTVLKSYIDHIVRAGRTFVFEETGPRGLVQAVTGLVITAEGGNYRKPKYQPFDFLEPYLRAILGILGIRDLTFVRAFDMNSQGGALREQSLAKVQSELEKLAAEW